MDVTFLKHLEGQIDRNPLSATDQILEAFARLESGDFDAGVDQLLDIFLKATLQCSEDTITLCETSEPSVDLFLSDEVSDRTLRFAAISWLRLLSASPQSIHRSVALSQSVFTLLDKGLERDVYGQLGIAPDVQTFEKEQKLRSVIPDVEMGYAEVLQAVGSLEALPALHNELRGFLKQTMCQAILGPFLPRQLLGSRMSELFQRVRSYVDSSGIERINQYQDAHECLVRYSADAARHQTKYAREVLGDLADLVLDPLERDFDRSPFSKPAHLVVPAPRKKIPLHAVGREIDFPITILNKGPGYAQRATVRMEVEAPLSIAPAHAVLELGSVPPGTMELEVPVCVSAPTSDRSAECLIEVTWENFDGTNSDTQEIISIEAQRSDIDWEQLALESPYSLEPVIREEDLIGRTEILSQLVAGTTGDQMASFVLYGQKRVGKTSVARTLKTRVDKSADSDLHAIYVEAGDFVHPEAASTVASLGELLCDQLRDADSRLSDLAAPDFSGAFSPMSRFLAKVVARVPDFRCVFLLDEFDELPDALFHRGEVADAFFLTIRSISGKPNFSFILVGSENMEFILRHQGTALNKFLPRRLDYFDKETNWASFVDLVRYPVSKSLEISDDAIACLYDKTAGNPYFTKFVCAELYALAVKQRDAHITEREARRAVANAVANARSNSFQHFWEDGVFEVDERRKEVRLQRRMLLFVLSSLFRRSATVSRDQINAEASAERIEFGGDPTLQDFVRRGVFLEESDEYWCAIGLFQDWLCESGSKEIAATHSEFEDLWARKEQEEALYVTSEEIVDTVARWDLYKGEKITEDRVRAWLDQFQDVGSQRLMFKILSGLTFYSQSALREKMREAHGIVVRGLVRKIERGKQKRADVLISYCDGAGKSGAEYARLYADENQIYADNVIERPQLAAALEKRADKIQSLVFLDDIIGTGESMSAWLEELQELCGSYLESPTLKTTLVVVTGLESGLKTVESALARLNLPIELYVCDSPGAAAACFGEQSAIFPDREERGRAKDICHRYGRELEKNHPLGYGGCEATIVFSATCPNNTLPVLWKSTQSWRPLFRRL